MRSAAKDGDSHRTSQVVGFGADHLPGFSLNFSAQPAQQK